MVRHVFFILFALAVVAGLYYSGLLASINLLHPFWGFNATLFGSLLGVAVGGLLLWVKAHIPGVAPALRLGSSLIFLVALGVSLYAARVFIESPDFEPLAANIWHKGAYIVFASFVASLLLWLANSRIIGSASDR